MKYFILIFLALVTFSGNCESLNVSTVDKNGIRWLVVSGDGFSPFYGVDIEMSYSADRLAIVEFDQAEKHVPVLAGDWLGSDAFTVVNRADSRHGSIRYAASILNPSPAVRGSGILFSVPFRSISGQPGEFAIVRAAVGTRSGDQRDIVLPGAVKVMPALSAAAAGDIRLPETAPGFSMPRNQQIPLWLLAVMAVVIVMLSISSVLLFVRSRKAGG